jgi:hypothetical protein
MAVHSYSLANMHVDGMGYAGTVPVVDPLARSRRSQVVSPLAYEACIMTSKKSPISGKERRGDDGPSTWGNNTKTRGDRLADQASAGAI